MPTHDQKPTNNHNVIHSTLPLYSQRELVRTGWETVNVPEVWQKYAEKHSIYEGVCWFYREFELCDVTENSFVDLVFKGVNYRADIYVNGQYVVWHESAYTEFSFDISAFAKNGRNCIAVQVDNRPTIVKWPNDWGYGVYGGIHRDVFVEVFNDEYVTDIALIPNYDVENNCSTLHFERSLHGAEKVKLKLGEDERTLKGESGRICADRTFENISAWTTDSPSVYPCIIKIGDDVYKRCNIGFRNIRCEINKIMLNGKPFRLKGVCYVYDTPVYGIVMDREQLKRDLIMMKEANVNAIRTHYPMSDDFYELCDEIGFVSWIEPNIYCSKPASEEVNTVFARKDFVDVAMTITEEMIKAVRQYASVIIYGIGNECNVAHPEAIVFFEKIAALVRDLDNSRLVGYAALYYHVGNMHEIVDIIGINSYHGWYGTIKTFDINDNRVNENGEIEKRIPNVSGLYQTLEIVKSIVQSKVPLLITEFGADSVPGFYSESNELWSENYHAEVVTAYIEESLKHEEITGTFVFNFTYYPDPSKPINGRWNGLNLKGILTHGREVKLPYYALKDAYRNLSDKPKKQT